MASQKGRVLVDFTYQGVTYKPGDLIEIDEEDVRVHRRDVDTHPDAVRVAEAEARHKRLQRPGPVDAAVANIISG